MTREVRTYTRQSNSSMPATASPSASISEALGHHGASSTHVLRRAHVTCG